MEVGNEVEEQKFDSLVEKAKPALHSLLSPEEWDIVTKDVKPSQKDDFEDLIDDLARIKVYLENEEYENDVDLNHAVDLYLELNNKLDSLKHLSKKFAISKTTVMVNPMSYIANQRAKQKLATAFQNIIKKIEDRKEQFKIYPLFDVYFKEQNIETIFPGQEGRKTFDEQLNEVEKVRIEEGITLLEAMRQSIVAKNFRQAMQTYMKLIESIHDLQGLNSTFGSEVAVHISDTTKKLLSFLPQHSRQVRFEREGRSGGRRTKKQRRHTKTKIRKPRRKYSIQKIQKSKRRNE